MSGCDRELNAHFYSAASLKYHGPDTWHDTTPSYIILTLGQPGAGSTIFTDFGMFRPGLKPAISSSPERMLFQLSFMLSRAFHNGPGHAKTWLMPYANKKGAAQTAHLHSLISTFVVCCLNSICILAIAKGSRF